MNYELIFLIYLHSLQVKIHSIKQLVLLYQVYSNWCLYNELIFLIYLHSLQVMNHSLKQLVLILRVCTWVLMIIKMFLSLMVNILMVKMHSSDYIRIIFNIMRVWYLFLYSLESCELVNQIFPHVIQWSNDIVDNNPLVVNGYNYAKVNDKNWSSIIVKEGLFDLRKELID